MEKRLILLAFLSLLSISLACAEPLIYSEPSSPVFGEDITFSIENDQEQEISIIQFLVYKGIDREGTGEVVYGSGPIRENGEPLKVNPNQKRDIFTWNQEGNTQNYKQQLKKGTYTAIIRYSIEGEAKKTNRIFEIPIGCGDGTCDASYTISTLTEGYKTEDASTCYQDCAFTQYSKCSIDSISGGTCEFKGKSYEITNVEFNGCGGMQGSSVSLTFSLGDHEVNIPGLSPNSWISVMDGISISAYIWPCATYTSTKTIVLRGSSEGLSNLLSLDKIEYNLKKDKEATFDYTIPEWLSEPYCKDRVINTETDEEMTMREALGCNSNTFDIENFQPDKYSVISEIYDNTANNKLGEDSINFVVHECLVDEECSDGSFFTKDVCSEDEIKRCSNPTNIVIILIIIIVIVLIIVILFSVFKRK